MNLTARFTTLLDKYKQAALTGNEEQELAALIRSGKYAFWLEEDIWQTLQELPEQEPVFSAQQSAAILASVVKAAQPTPKAPVYKGFRWLRWSAAAALLLVLGSAAYWKLGKNNQPKIAATQHQVIAPASSKAILTLANGKQVTLESSGQQSVAGENGTQLIAVNNGVITYNTKLETTANTLTWNTLRTAKGGQFKIILPDGSSVRLNAASVLKYPVAFTAATRTVELEGEAFFEITPNKSQPFHVKTNRSDITVLGTSFNINAYADEPLHSTTLLAGSIRVATTGRHNNNAIRELKPGEQISINADNNIAGITKPVIDEVMAWTQGDFRFNETDIEVIMRQLQRWYDIDVKYQGNMSGIRLSGVIARLEQANELLKAFELTGKIHFQINGKQITVIAGKK